ncbi:MAG: alpha/beta hydrolase [Myxococcota bacterium]
MHRHGTGPAVILIPGLTCGADVWDETVQRLEGRYELHVLTLSGFAGRPPIDGPLLPRVREDLAAYIRAEGLRRPAVVGHSLGGFMALWLGATEPDLVGPLVAVDGLPSLAAAMNVPGPQVEAAAAAMRDQMASLDADAFAAQTRASLTGLMVSPDDVATVAQTAVRSDPPTVGKAMYEMLTRDLRQDVAAIESDVLLFGPGVGTPEQRTMVESVYREQMAAVPTHEVVFAEGSRHFVMLDARAFFAETLDAFLDARLGAAK